MSVNRYRGEVSARLDGKEWRLCLTLGSLAELEDAFDAGNLSELAERLSGASLSASGLSSILGAGLRGAGHEISDEQASRMSHEDGAAGIARICARLLSAAFGSEGASAEGGVSAEAGAEAEGAGESATRAEDASAEDASAEASGSESPASNPPAARER